MEVVKEPSPQDTDPDGNHPKTVLNCCSKEKDSLNNSVRRFGGRSIDVA
jgi:hypothetical protein